MRRMLASVMLVWYAVLAMGFHLHVHYCCGQVADIAINSTHEKCSGSCSAPETTQPEPAQKSCCMATSTEKQCAKPVADRSEHQITKHCCSSDDFYIALKDLHQKTQFELDAQPVVARLARTHVYPQESEEAHLPAVSSVFLTAPPLWLLFQRQLFFADEDPADLA